MYYYSKTNNGFYHSDIHSEIPSDGVELTDEEWKQLIDGQSKGKIIVTDDNGTPYLAESTKTKEQITNSLSNKIQIKLDEYAKSWGYDSMISAVSYVNSNNPQYSAEASALNGWRDEVWDWATTKFDTITDKEPENFLENMPSPPVKPVI